MSTDTALHRLLVKAQMASTDYFRNLWFKDCRLEKNLLICPDRATAESIARLFLPNLRKVLSDIEVRTETGKTVTAHWPSKADVLLKQQTAKKVYSGKATATEQDVDLLDEHD